MSVQKTVEVEQWVDNDYPIVMFFLPSGFPGKTILVSEDPYDDCECRLIDEEEKAQIIQKFKDKEDGQAEEAI